MRRSRPKIARISRGGAGKQIKSNLNFIGNGKYRLDFPDKGTITVYANSEKEAVRKINKQLKPKSMFIQKKINKYWTFPNNKPAPNNYIWDGKGWINNKYV